MKIGPADDVFAPPGGVFPGIDALGAYHLLRPLATGGMARVWLAIDARDGKQVAVKRMLSSLAIDPELRNAFVDEGELGLRLRHPNIVETLELGEAATAMGPEPYLVLELLRGRALIEVLRAAARQDRPVPLGFAIRAVLDAARGLTHAHALADDHGHPLGIVHRDVTPHNLFVCTSGTIKVLDFGIAKAFAQHHKTRAGVIKGKFAYLAPEQIRGQVPDARLDVWALGIVLYELLTGKPLFRGSNDGETLNRILSHEIEPPEAVRPDVPPALGAIALRALQRDRDRRLPSASALAESLEAVAGAEGIAQRPAEVRDFVAALFPKDASEHAEDNALAQRTYEHLSSGSLRAIGSNPWMTPAEGLELSERRPARSMLARGALLLGALCLTATAAIVTATALSRHAVRQREPLPIAAAPVAPSRQEVPQPAAAPPPPREELPSVPPPSAALRKPGRAHPQRTTHAGQGSLRLAAQPWAEVSIDGKPFGTTPLPVAHLADGPHTVTFKNDQLGVSVKRRVTVVANKELLLVVDLFAEKKR